MNLTIDGRLLNCSTTYTHQKIATHTSQIVPHISYFNTVLFHSENPGILHLLHIAPPLP